ncbi:MAG: hypothetical protein ACRDHZ_07550, partial [Ktedonobacteraceae bacterium]
GGEVLGSSVRPTPADAAKRPSTPTPWIYTKTPPTIQAAERGAGERAECLRAVVGPSCRPARAARAAQGSRSARMHEGRARRRNAFGYFWRNKSDPARRALLIGGQAHRGAMVATTCG